MINLNELQQQLNQKNTQPALELPAANPAAAIAADEPAQVAEPAEKQGRAALKMQLDEELKQWKSRCAALAAERELALALSGQALLPGVAGQLLRLWRDTVVAQPEAQGHGFEVKSADGRQLGDAVKEWLQSPEFQHFRVAGTRGGTAVRSEAASATERSVAAGSTPRSLNEIVIHQWRQRSARQPQGEVGGMWPNR